MTTTVDDEADVWVHDYTTTSGVHVAGHWRRRRSAAPETATDDGAGTAGPAELTPPAPAGGRAKEDPPRPPGTPIASEPAVSPSERLTAAETRYKAAAVEVGLQSLRNRRGDAAGMQAALTERAQAKAELDAARTAVLTQTEPSAPSEPPQSNDPSRAHQQDRCPGCGQYRAQDHQCPVPEGLPEGNYAALKGDDRVKAMVADLEASVKSIVESGQLHRWLDAMASNGMSRWSGNNRLLAALQLLRRGESLDNLHLMGFRQWEKFNRKVSKGAKAVWILAPITRKVVDDDDGTEEHRVVGFKGVPVFNVSDTEGEALPTHPSRPVEGAATPGTLEGLRARVGQAGYTYEEEEIPDYRPGTAEGTLGYTHPKSKRIVVDSRLSDAQKASTIAHELGHVHCGHVDGDFDEYRRHRGQMETEAEMTAYLVSRSRGMTREQVDAFSPGYIAGWSKGDPAVMHRAVDKATRAFNKITDGPWPDAKD